MSEAGQLWDITESHQRVGGRFHPQEFCGGSKRCSHGGSVTSAPQPDGQFDKVDCNAFFDLRVAALEADGAFVLTSLGWAVEGSKIGDPEVQAVPVLPRADRQTY